ncbi:MAG: Periplasmic binding protein [Methanothrix harundinacea]|uniref:Periplasmic binding protein n=1 Tax=Methanothrix harundinacea TaxID=301375 RepID=A0A101IK74_9EURY|nr:MAG: Periplasmic binding protein [Methanothrix harundinacea]KUK96749.1 MAG: Periplasmic binding protein [Methanothrix harundinacea]
MNRPFKHAILMAIAIMLSSSLPGTMLGAESAEDDRYPMTVTDSAGREVTIPVPVQRAVVLNTDAAEAITILGASNRIVGLAEGIKETYEFYRLKDRPSVGTWTDIDYEMIGEIAYNGSQIMTPDIIVVGYVYPGKPNGVDAVSKSLESIEGLSVLGLDFYKEENLSRELSLMGLILGTEDRAKEVLDWYDEKAVEVESAVVDLDRPRVYLESGSSTGVGELTTFGAQSGSAMLLEKARGENVVKEEMAYPKVDWEWVVSQNPDVIIKTDYLKASDGLPGWSASSSEDADKLEEKLDELLSRPGARKISAVENGRVYIVKAQSLFGMDSVFGLQLLAEILHPGIELDAEEVYGEYLEFMGLEEKEGRIFVYPAM